MEHGLTAEWVLGALFLVLCSWIESVEIGENPWLGFSVHTPTHDPSLQPRKRIDNRRRGLYSRHRTWVPG
jgi:hypothetical protein